MTQGHFNEKLVELDIKDFQCRIKRMKPKQSDIGITHSGIGLGVLGVGLGGFRFEHSWVLQVQVVGPEALTPPALVQPLTDWLVFNQCGGTKA